MEAYSLIIYEVVGDGVSVALIENEKINETLRKDLDYINGHYANSTEDEKAADIINSRGWFENPDEDIVDYYLEQENFKQEEYGLFFKNTINTQEEGKPFNWQNIPANKVGIVTHIYHYGFIA